MVSVLEPEESTAFSFNTVASPDRVQAVLPSEKSPLII